MKAIESESFDKAVDMLKETELLNFDSPSAKLGHQVSQLGFSAKGLSSGAKMSDFDYRAIKSSLLSASNRPMQGEAISPMESYEKYMDRFSVEI